MKSKLFGLLILILFCVPRVGKACEQVDLLVLGDSQFGATWAKSYSGNFLQGCLKGSFALYARGGTIPGNWIGKGGMDQIETIERTPSEEHLNIGSGDKVPLCKKRLGPMIEAHKPRRILLEFGGNYISSKDDFIKNDIENLMRELEKYEIEPQNCYFLHQTYEMEVDKKRNVPLKNITNTIRILNIIKDTISNRCQLIDGMELMKNSSYFDGVELLKRIPIENRSGCFGAAVNDNAHVCGAAAKDFADRVCRIINSI